MPPSQQYYDFTKPQTPILLLKTKSSPQDGYEEFFSTNYNPAFIPVLEHRFNDTNLGIVRELFENQLNGDDGKRKYGGLIFTSQRAVEGFARVVEGIDVNITTQSSKSLLLYTVGPATSRSLSTLAQTHLPHATIHGADTGNGENLAHFILSHYNSIYPEIEAGGEGKPPLLFLVGEQRRDIIPKILMDQALPAKDKISVEELVVYETGVMSSFERDFATAISEGRAYLTGSEERAMWVVVFSPTGCDAMLRVLGLGKDADGEGEKGREGRRIFVATIGPTTRDHLRNQYGFEADVCAERPSQEGVGKGIERYMEGRRKA